MNEKTLCIIALISISIFAGAQGSIPNGNFETWTSGTYEYPANYPYNSNTAAFWSQTPYNLTKITDAYHGTYAVQLTTNASATDTSVGYFINGDPDGSNWHGGFPYSQTPTGIRGYYKCNIAVGDSALIVASFSKSGNNIGQYFFKLGGVKTSYTLFNFTFSPALAMAPDSVMFGATSSDFLANVMMVGSTLKLDSVSFTGVTSQPALMNGSFENWQNQTLERPDNWYVNNWDGQMNKTIDAAAGNYAMELTTTLGDYGYGPRAVAGQISTGYYDNSCNCMKGGYPFSNQIDTLVFSYKYSPMTNDSAEVYLNFKKNGSTIWGTNKRLGASASYQVVQIPFNIGQAPDTVIVEIRSSLWQDSAVSFVGSVIKIDEIHFKSQPLNTSVPVFSYNNSIHIFPNPSNGKIQVISNRYSVIGLEIYNVYGEKVYSQIFPPQRIASGDNPNSLILNLDVPNGIYFVKMTSNEKIFTKKITINK